MLLFSTGLDLMCAYNQFCFKGDLTVFERETLRKYRIAADGAVGLLKRSESGGESFQGLIFGDTAVEKRP